MSDLWKKITNKNRIEEKTMKSPKTPNRKKLLQLLQPPPSERAPVLRRWN